MFDFNPFITNDGSVGLYSKEDNDIYHSVYGALSESYEKFVLPANLPYFLKNKSQINFLDICYGIGYNSKSLIQFLINFLNDFSENIFENYSEKFFNEQNEIYSIYTDKIKLKNDSQKDESIHTDKINIKNIKNYSETIYTDNNFKKNKKSNKEKINISYDESIDGDNNSEINFCKKEKIWYKFSIDAIDLNKNLIMLSPFIKNKFNYKNILKIDLPEVKKIKNKLKPQKLKDEYQISNYVLKLLFESLIRTDYFDNDFVKRYINDKKYKMIFSPQMRAIFNEFYKSQGIINQNHDLFSFLHNIYYQYLSKRFIKGCKTPKNGTFDINLIYKSAVDFLIASDKTYDVVFLDAFTPAKCPKLWTIDFLKLIYEHLSDDGIVLTYSNSAQVRNAFLHAGFFIGKNYSEEKNKSFGTIASKNKLLIKFELDDYEKGLLNTKAGIFYKDVNFSLEDEEIIKMYKYDFENSTLISSSKYKKSFKNNV